MHSNVYGKAIKINTKNHCNNESICSNTIELDRMKSHFIKLIGMIVYTNDVFTFVSVKNLTRSLEKRFENSSYNYLLPVVNVRFSDN